jgi:hypothetical protein
LLQNIWFLEKMAHFDREVIPERRMHAKGAGAHGTFTVTHDITKYTKAKIFSEIGKKTQMFVRFSTVAGERGAADAERDIRGFALKFYTDEGNRDLRGTAARGPFDAIMSRVIVPAGVTFAADTVGGVSGWWCRPEGTRTGEAILGLHGGWFNWGSAQAYRNLVGHIAARTGVEAFICNGLEFAKNWCSNWNSNAGLTIGEGASNSTENPARVAALRGEILRLQQLVAELLKNQCLRRRARNCRNCAG